ncbi:MAG: choice-of-anchor D domain-containing protein [Candidatus Kapaibacterium sp.]
MKIFIRSLIILLLAGVSAQAQNSVYILDHDQSAFPEVSARFIALDGAGNAIGDLRMADVSVSDNGSIVPVLSFSSPAHAPVERISLTVAFDLGLNSSQTFGNFQIGQKLAGNVVGGLDFEMSECALTSFDMYSYMNSDFVRDGSGLLGMINGFTPAAGSDVDEGMLAEPLGAIETASGGDYRRSVLLITDAIDRPDAGEIIKWAKHYNIKIIVASLNEYVPAEFSRIADETGGYLFSGINKTSDLDLIAKLILNIAHNIDVYEVVFRGELNCDESHIYTLNVEKLSAADDFTISIDDSLKPALEAEPPFLGFSSVLPGTTRELPVIITAVNKDIRIADLSINHPFFEIDPATDLNDQVLPKGQSHTIIVKFMPQDSAIVFTKLDISSDACFGGEILITGGFPNTPPRERTIELRSPACGDVLAVGDTTWVEWTGLLPKDVIQLEFTTDGGNKWDTLAKDVTGLKYKWTVPDSPSDNCYARAIQLWPNNIGRTLDLWHDGSVNSAMFNKDGSLVVTASRDTTASVWNSNNGDKLFDLIGHTKPVHYAEFDSTEKYIVTASKDSTAIIWDMKTGELLRTLRGHNQEVRSARFSPDGTKILTASYDATVMIWDTETGEALDTIDCGQGRLWFASWSPDGYYIATAGNDGFVKIWNPANKQLFESFDTRFGAPVGNVVHVSYSPDAKRIVASSWFGRASVWDISSGDTLFTMTHGDTLGNLTPINSGYFFYHKTKGKYVITAGRDYKAKLWDADNGNFLTSFVEHRSNVQSAIFNFDGSRVLTASWDSTAKIWNLDKRDLQMDTTDCAFRIAHADAEIARVDFGEVVVGQRVDSVITEFISNKSPFPVEIKELKLSGADASKFTFKENIAPVRLDSGQSIRVEISYLPDAPGLHTADIEIGIPGKMVTQTIRGRGISTGLLTAARIIDFSEVETDEFRDTTITHIVRNVSTNVIEIDSIFISGPDDNHFDIISGGNPLTLSPGDGIEMKIRFTPEDLSRRNGLLEFHYDGMPAPERINLFGRGIRPIIDTATIGIGSASGKPGEIVEIPVYIKNVGASGIRESILGFTAELSFNGSLLEPLDNIKNDGISGLFRTITFNMPSEIPADSVLTRLKFRVGLGTDTTTKLNLMNLRPIGIGKVRLFQESGRFDLTGICRENGDRLFDPQGRIVLMQNRPNPATETTTIDFELIEGGHTTLEVLDLLGRRIKTITDEYMTPGKYSYDISVAGLPAGVYQYVLTTPTVTISRRIEVQR